MTVLTKALSTVIWLVVGGLVLGLLVGGVPLGVPSTLQWGQALRDRAGRWPFRRVDVLWPKG
jgi:hypothetical protein